MSDPAKNAFRMFSNCFSKKMQGHGFRNLPRMRFIKQNFDTCILVELQKEQRPSDRNAIRFTINVGISVNQIREELRPEKEVGSVAESLDIDDCNWKKRLATLIGEKSDVWWSVRDEADAEWLCGDLAKKTALIAMPQVEKMASVDSLLDSWTNGVGHGLTEYQRLSYTARLLLALGRNRQAMSAIEVLEKKSVGTSWEGRAALDTHEYRNRVQSSNES